MVFLLIFLTMVSPCFSAGDASSEASRYGGHVMCVPGAKCQVAGVLGFRMGQENVMGRRGGWMARKSIGKPWENVGLLFGKHTKNCGKNTIFDG